MVVKIVRDSLAELLGKNLPSEKFLIYHLKVHQAYFFIRFARKWKNNYCRKIIVIKK